MKFDHEYVNIKNPYHVVKWTLDGEYVEIDGECTDEQLEKMNNLDDVPGFVLVDREAKNLSDDVQKEADRLMLLGEPKPLAVRTAIIGNAIKHKSGAYNLHYS